MTDQNGVKTHDRLPLKTLPLRNEIIDRCRVNLLIAYEDVPQLSPSCSWQENNRTAVLLFNAVRWKQTRSLGGADLASPSN